MPLAQGAGRFIDVLDREGWHLPQAKAELVRGAGRAAGAYVAGPDFGRLAYVAVLLAVLALHTTTALQASPGAPLGYVHLLAAKDLGLGLGPFASGVLPLGLPALMATVSSLFSLDAVNVLRALLPLTAFLLALGAGELSRRIGKSDWAGALGAGLCGISTLPGLGAATFHLTTPLGPNLALALALMAIALAWDLVSRDASSRIGEAARAEGKPYGQEAQETGTGTGTDAGAETARRAQPANPDLWARAALYGSLAAATAFDPWAGALTLIPVGILLLGEPPGPDPTVKGWRHGVGPLLQAVAAVGIACLPVVVALGLGRPLLAAAWASPVPLPAGLGPVLRLAAVPVAVSVLAMVWTSRPRSRTASDRRVQRLVYGLLAITALTLLGPGFLRVIGVTDCLPSILALALFAGSAIHSLKASMVTRAGDVARVTLASLLVAGLFLRHVPRIPSRYEPAGSGEAYLAIADRLPHFTWTIISPVDQYPEVLGRGFHVELADFVRDASDRLAARPSFRLRRNPGLRIATPEVFLFIDLRPQGLGRTIRPSDARLPLPPLGSGGEYSGVGGAAIDARALDWARAYLRAHPRGANVFLKTADLLVIRIQQ